MPQQELEMILTRQLASYLAIPIGIMDPQGTLLFYNEPVERILGVRFEGTGEMSAAEWASLFMPKGEPDVPLEPEALPHMIALTEQRLAYGRFWIEGLDQAIPVKVCCLGIARQLITALRRFPGMDFVVPISVKLVAFDSTCSQLLVRDFDARLVGLFIEPSVDF